MRRSLPFCAVLALAAWSAGCGKPAAPPEVPPAAPVKWETASSVVLEEWADLVGTTQPLPGASAQVTAPIDGRVVSLLQRPVWLWTSPVHEGDLVAAGDVIVQLDTRLAVLNRDQAQAALNLAVEKLNALKALQQKNPSLVPDIDLKTAQSTEQDARAKLEATQAQLRLYSLNTPIAGRLGQINVALGQTLAVGASAAEVVNIEDRIDVLCLVPQHTALSLREKQAAALGGVEPRPGEVRSAATAGRVAFISEMAEAENGCFAVKVRFPNKNPRLRSNVVQRVRVNLADAQKPPEARLAVPEAALIEDQDPPAVVIAENIEAKKNADGKEEQVGTARRMQAKVGVRDRVLKQVEILGLTDPEGKWSGSLEDVQFIVQGAAGLQTGDAVRLAADED